VAFPTETVYGLGADARNPQAVARIFAVKGRPADHPLIVHLPDASRLTEWARNIPRAAWQLAEAFWPGPLTLVLPRAPGVLLRDGDVLVSVLPDTARRFARAMIMPNLDPPVRTVEEARAYRDRILAALPAGLSCEPLMTLYLTDHTTSEEILRAKASGLVHAVGEAFLVGATTNSAFGVTDFARCDAVFAAMEEAGLPLLLHGEVTDPEVDVFDREAVFIERHLRRIVERFPHLKRERHRQALVEAATSGNPKFFLGTDSAPHPRYAKESTCGCAGIYTAHAEAALKKAGAMPQMFGTITISDGISMGTEGMKLLHHHDRSSQRLRASAPEIHATPPLPDPGVLEAGGTGVVERQAFTGTSIKLALLNFEWVKRHAG
jgi:dihydroorotase